MSSAPTFPAPKAPQASTSLIRAHLQIARIDHWTKNVFVLPGIIIPLTIQPAALSLSLALQGLIGFASVCLISSSNYVINEIMDAPYDRFHPAKQQRPVVQGRVNLPLAYLQWVVLMLAGIGLAGAVSRPFLATMAAFWLMGCIYNIPPVRSKDLPYIDVLTEAVNNPLRMCGGWFIVTRVMIPPASLLLSYWMVGCYFMGVKRFSEYRQVSRDRSARSYRKSFGYYSERSILVSVMFYASAAMLFFGAFIMRYRLELILSFPFVALVMAVYLHLAFSRDSAVQNPETLYRQPLLMASLIICALVMVALMWIDIPKMHRVFSPTMPAIGQRQGP